MGRDKALLRWGDRSLVEHAATTLEACGLPVALACGPHPRYEDFGWPRVLDRPCADGASTDGIEGTSTGPLAGLEAGLDAYFGGESDPRSGWLVILGCDQPGVRREHLQALLAGAIEGDLDVCGLRSPRGPEPTIAVVRSTCLPRIRGALARGERRMCSFHTEPDPGDRSTALDGAESEGFRLEPVTSSTRGRSIPGDVRVESSARRALRVEWLAVGDGQGGNPGLNLNTPQDYRGARLGSKRPTPGGPHVSRPFNPSDGDSKSMAQATDHGSEDRLAAAKRP